MAPARSMPRSAIATMQPALPTTPSLLLAREQRLGTTMRQGTTMDTALAPPSAAGSEQGGTQLARSCCRSSPPSCHPLRSPPLSHHLYNLHLHPPALGGPYLCPHHPQPSWAGQRRDRGCSPCPCHGCAHDKGSLRGDTEEGRARESRQPGLSPVGFIPHRGCLPWSQPPYPSPPGFSTMGTVFSDTAELGTGHSYPGAAGWWQTLGVGGGTHGHEPKSRGTHTRQLFPGCLGTAASSSRAGGGPWMQNLAVRGSVGWQWGPGLWEKMPKASSDPVNPNGSSHVAQPGKATSPQGRSPGQPLSHHRSPGPCQGWVQKGGRLWPPGFCFTHTSPARTTVPLEHRRQRGRAPGAAAPPSPGRSAVTSQPWVHLQPVSSYSQTGALCHHTVPCWSHHCHASQELCAPAPGSQPGCGVSHHIPFSPPRFRSVVHPLSNARVQVGQPCHSSGCSGHRPQGCQEQRDSLNPSSTGQCDSSTVLQAPPRHWGVSPCPPKHPSHPEPAADFHPLQFPPPQTEDGDPASPRGMHTMSLPASEGCP